MYSVNGQFPSPETTCVMGFQSRSFLPSLVQFPFFMRDFFFLSRGNEGTREQRKPSARGRKQAHGTSLRTSTWGKSTIWSRESMGKNKAKPEERSLRDLHNDERVDAILFCRFVWEIVSSAIRKVLSDFCPFVKSTRTNSFTHTLLWLT